MKTLKPLAVVVEALITISTLALIILMLLDYVTLAVVEGTSMEPTLQSGDLVLVIKRVSLDDISLGDVIVYRRGRSLIIHRVVRIEDGTIITKGDNNLLLDPPVRFSDVVGKVLEIGGNIVKIPLIGYLTLFFRYSTSSFTNFPVLRNLDKVITYSVKLIPMLLCQISCILTMF